MSISTVGQGNGVGQVRSKAPKNPPKSSEESPQVATAKKDLAVISERARDLAAREAGKAASEEASESISAKAQESAGA
jgi:hypothetical protein